MSDVFRLIIFQFSFSNPEVIPSRLLELPEETSKESSERKKRANGVIFISPIEGCSLEKASKDIFDKYELVEALYQKRHDPKNPAKPYHMVRFVFAKKEFSKPEEDFEKKKNLLEEEFLYICRTSLWRVRGFSNPYFENEKEIEGMRTISVNAEARVPLFYPDGKPVLVWDKDTNGNKIGEKSHPIVPKKIFRFHF